MEISQPVRVRGEQWRIVDIRSFERCRLIALASGQRSRSVLIPFDDVEPIVRGDRPLPVTPHRWRAAFRDLLVTVTPPGGLRTATGASIDLLPHQLEPALAVLRGAGSRVLLADDVGLGKTIQAGLIVAELFARQAAERVLVLTPAGVRDQWGEELHRRFGLSTSQADAPAMRRLTATLPLGINPWQTMPLAIASIDYVKRLDVLPSVRQVRWDVVIVDEAHAAAGDSERRDAVRMLAARASFVLLLSATPHNGDPAAFDELRRIGALEADDLTQDQLLVFRRRRQDSRGDRSRRIHVLRVRPSVAERHMYAALDRYRSAVAAEHGDRALALAVLDKRAVSSPWSLAQSIDRRLAALADAPTESDQQLALPFNDPDGELTDDDAPPLWPAELALSDRREDRRLLTAVAAAARSAALHDDSKLRRLQRLLRRTRESVLVFTEYRDTAMHVAAALAQPVLQLHGGMNRIDRSGVVDQFCRKDGTILIATDAAGQGLNLHHRCRLVVNIELPWNPMRLEQRIGRVDRIGQRHVVHAVHLVAADTFEIDVLARLKTRVNRARAAIDAADPLGANGGFEPVPEERLQFADQREAASGEVHRTSLLRGLVKKDVVASVDPRNSGRPLTIDTRRLRRFRARLCGRMLAVYRVDAEDRDGRIVESRLVPLMIDRAASDADRAAAVAAIVEQWRRAVRDVVAPFQAMRLARARALGQAVASSPISLFQPALFDRRAERARRGAIDRRTLDLHEADEVIAAIERQAIVGEPIVRLQLIARP